MTLIEAEDPRTRPDTLNEDVIMDRTFESVDLDTTEDDLNVHMIESHNSYPVDESYISQIPEEVAAVDEMEFLSSLSTFS